MLFLILALAVWLVAGAFFTIIAVSVGRGGGTAAPIADLHAAAVTAGYSLGAALLLLGTTWIVLPAARPAIGRAGILWIAVTALLLGTRQVSGWPLFVAAIVALAIALDVIRRLGAAIRTRWRDGRSAGRLSA